MRQENSLLHPPREFSAPPAPVSHVARQFSTPPAIAHYLPYVYYYLVGTSFEAGTRGKKEKPKTHPLKTRAGHPARCPSRRTLFDIYLVVSRVNHYRLWRNRTGHRGKPGCHSPRYCTRLQGRFR